MKKNDCSGSIECITNGTYGMCQNCKGRDDWERQQKIGRYGKSVRSVEKQKRPVDSDQE